MKTRIEKNKKKQQEIVKEKQKKELKIFLKIFFWILIIFSIIISYGVFIGAKIVIVNEIKITDKNIPTSFHGMKVVHFSDLLYPSFTENDLNKLSVKINNLKPDILVFTGNIQRQNYELTKEELTIIKNFFNSLNSKIKKYTVMGKNDNSIFQLIFEDTDFVILNNSENILYNYENEPLKIIGFNSQNLNNKNISNLECYTICLFSNPDLVDKINTNCNLTLSSSNLGGEIKLPFLKKGLINNYKYSSDYYELDNTKLYISNGIGNNYHVRYFNQPSINLYRLTQY